MILSLIRIPLPIHPFNPFYHLVVRYEQLNGRLSNTSNVVMPLLKT